MTGSVETVGIDWSFVGYGGIGQKIAMTTAVSLLFLDVGANQARLLDAAVFTGYLEGLVEAGWQRYARLVRLGYTATIGLVFGITWPAFSSQQLTDSEGSAAQAAIIGHSIDEIIDQWGEVLPLVFALGEEALALVQVL